MKRLLLFAAILGSVVSGSAITLGQVDDFEDGTLQNWRGGASPVNVATGGPRGIDDNYIRLTSTPTTNLGMANDVQWTGNWIAAGVTVVEAHLRNEGENPLEIRLVFTLGQSNRFTSTRAFMLPADGKWYKASFPVRASDLVRTAGTMTYTEMLSDVPTLLFRHDSGDPSHLPDPIEGVLGLDNIEASNKADLQPEVLTKIRGNETGTLQNLFFSDNIRMQWRPGIVFSPSQPPAEFDLDFFAPFVNPTAMSFNIEGFASSAGLHRQISLMNQSNIYVVVVPYTSSSTSETLVTVPVINFANYINPVTGLIRARISYRIGGPVFGFPWIGQQDKIFVRLMP
ncbi:MAG: hypothetical protein M3R13_03485 [Armatimonadota bacterium]|nr:hypothetical protein [Armatimonadota bacterium]